MASLRASIATRITLVVIAIHAVLLPLLFYGLYLVVRDSHAESFVQKARTFARNIAEELEIGAVLESPRRVSEFLDLAVLNAEAVYAEVLDRDRSVKSNLNNPNVRWPDRQDFEFGKSGDSIYCIKLPVASTGRSAELRLAFDERPTAGQVRLAMQRTFWVLAAYLCLVVVLAMAFGAQLARPVGVLKRSARRIASGDYAQNLELATGIRELDALATDLENMRRELVGVNERLRLEIAERERTEVRRIELERRLQHRHRIETVGTLAGGIAHEVNNALLPIVLLAEGVLTDLPADSVLRQDMAQILASARRAKEIVAQVLMFSRARDVSELRAIDLAAVTTEALRLFGILVPSSVEVRTEVDGSCPPVRADAALATQLIMNLCTNAYQAMHGQPGAMTVRLRVESVSPGAIGSEEAVPPGQYVTLSVIDSGHGMDEDTLERIFEPFFTTREVGAGSGLGLAVVHGIVESFGATILVDSAVGRGATFKVYFPLAASAVSPHMQLSGETR